MKYIITEDQSEKLKEVLFRYFDSSLAPGDGWEKKKSYKKDVEMYDEVFFFFDQNAEGLGESEDHMWYSVCDNHNLDKPLREDM